MKTMKRNSNGQYLTRFGKPFVRQPHSHQFVEVSIPAVSPSVTGFRISRCSCGALQTETVAK